MGEDIRIERKKDGESSPNISASLNLEGLRQSVYVSYPEGTSSKTIAKEIIWSTFDPFIELEKAGLIEKPRLVLHGSVVEGSSSPNDYDVMVIYDKVNSGEIDDVSKNAEILYKYLRGDGRKPKQVILELPIRSSFEHPKPHAKYVELWLRTKDSFLKAAEEIPEEVLDRAFAKLAGLPGSVYAAYDAYDAGYYDHSDKKIKPTIFVLLLAKQIGYSLKQHHLRGISGDQAYSKIVDPESLETSGDGNVNTEEKIEKYLKHHGHLVDDLLKEDGSLDIDSFANNLPTEIGQRVLKVYQGILAGTNPEMGIVKSGHLVYGENIQLKGKPLFVKDDFFSNPQN